MKPSTHILRGLKYVDECSLYYVSMIYGVKYGCAIGIGEIDKIGFEKAVKVSGIEDHCANLGLPLAVGNEVEALHLHHNISARQIAHWLKEAGY